METVVYETIGLISALTSDFVLTRGCGEESTGHQDRVSTGMFTLANKTEKQLVDAWQLSLATARAALRQGGNQP